MSHFAQIDENSIVVNVLVGEEEIFQSGIFGDPKMWIQTSYNTRGGVHYDPITHQQDGGVALRKNYASVGMIYDPIRDAFYFSKPYSGWLFDEDKCTWYAPIPYPSDGLDYEWDENTQNWKLLI